jgi:hypothetical protein
MSHMGTGVRAPCRCDGRPLGSGLASGVKGGHYYYDGDAVVGGSQSCLPFVVYLEYRDVRHVSSFCDIYVEEGVR